MFVKDIQQALYNHDQPGGNMLRNDVMRQYVDRIIIGDNSISNFFRLAVRC